MRKTFFYNFFPSKAEEEAEAARNAHHQVTRSLIEIRDWNSGHRFDPTNPWQIRRVVTRNEIAMGEITLSHEEMLEYVLRSWKLESANHVVQGNKCMVVLMDYTEENMPKTYPNSYVKAGGTNNECYVVGLADVFRGRVISAGDEIGLFWDMRPTSFGFCFKLLRRSNSKLP
ncbi:hypothetical protein M5689_021192 [Euphorbia peplus]|nr:hypothetical protein M5689_021192 [Euphorbia peplus]